MPRKRIAGKRRNRALTHQEEIDLILASGGAQWSDKERQAAWEDHKDVLMGLVNPGTRPAAFWDYEGYEKIPHESDLQALDRLGLLTDDEIRIHSETGSYPTEPATGEDPRHILFGEARK